MPSPNITYEACPFHHFTPVFGQERVRAKMGESHDVFRVPNSTHTIPNDCIHEIIDLPQSERGIVFQPQDKTRELGFWKFDEKGS